MAATNGIGWVVEKYYGPLCGWLPESKVYVGRWAANERTESYKRANPLEEYRVYEALLHNDTRSVYENRA